MSDSINLFSVHRPFPHAVKYHFLCGSFAAWEVRQIINHSRVASEKHHGKSLEPIVWACGHSVASYGKICWMTLNVSNSEAFLRMFTCPFERITPRHLSLLQASPFESRSNQRDQFHRATGGPFQGQCPRRSTGCSFVIWQSFFFFFFLFPTVKINSKFRKRANETFWSLAYPSRIPFYCNVCLGSRPCVKAI